jgi:hypothetical protein
MRIELSPALSDARASWVRRAAFTLPEIVIAMGLVVIVFAGMLASHIFGMKLMERSNAKADASAEAWGNFNTLMGEICSAKGVAVGSGGQSSFSEIAIDTAQKGPALQIYPTTDTNVFIRYYLNTAAKTLNRMTNGATPVVIASGIKNTDLFTAEDVAGNIVTNNQNNCAIGLLLQFQQVQYTNLPVGTGNYYTSYQVRTKIARRPF